VRDSSEGSIGFELGRCVELSPQQPGSATPIAAVIAPIASVIAPVAAIIAAVFAAVMTPHGAK
jgi:hypothetical protein